jgi:hypothetical protein
LRGQFLCPFSDLNELSENQIHLTTYLSKNIKGYPIQIILDLDNFINYANTDSEDIVKTDVKILQLNSFISIEKYDFDIDLGFSSDYILDDLNGAEIGLFPYVNISKCLVKDILYIEGGLENNGYRNTIKSLSDDNPYIYAFATNQNVVFDDFNTLDVWMTIPLSASIILDPNATQMGIAWHQDANGKIWWVQLIAS